MSSPKKTTRAKTKPKTKTPEPLAIGDKAPELTDVKWVKGGSPATEGRVTVVELWSSDCSPCQLSAAHLTVLKHRHGDAVEIIGLTAEDEATVKEYVKKLGNRMDYHVGMAPPELYERWSLGVDSVPHAFVFDEKGSLVWASHPNRVDGILLGLTSGTLDAKRLDTLRALREKLDELDNEPAPEEWSDEWLARGRRRVDILAKILELNPADGATLYDYLFDCLVKEFEDDRLAALKNLRIELMNAADATTIATELMDNTLYRGRDFELAYRLVEHAQAVYPDMPELQTLWARMLSQLGEHAEAVAVARHAAKLDEELNAVTALHYNVENLEQIARVAAARAKPKAKQALTS